MKSDQKKPSPTYINEFKFAVLTVSDRCSRGENKDENGKIIIDMVNTIIGQPSLPRLGEGGFFNGHPQRTIKALLSSSNPSQLSIPQKPFKPRSNAV